MADQAERVILEAEDQATRVVDQANAGLDSFERKKRNRRTARSSASPTRPYSRDRGEGGGGRGNAGVPHLRPPVAGHWQNHQSHPPDPPRGGPLRPAIDSGHVLLPRGRRGAGRPRSTDLARPGGHAALPLLARVGRPGARRSKRGRLEPGQP